MRDHVDVRAVEGDPHPRHQMVARLAAAHVQRGDHEVVAGEEVVVVVEAAVRPNLQLAAVEEPEGMGRPRGGLPLEPIVELADDRALRLDPAGVEPAYDGMTIEV